MYKDFHALDRWSKKKVHCIYQALIVAVATRHADAVDIKFLVDGHPVWVALPHPACRTLARREMRSFHEICRRPTAAGAAWMCVWCRYSDTTRTSMAYLAREWAR